MNPIGTPNGAVTSETTRAIMLMWIVAALVVWSVVRPVVFPSPLDVIGALPDLWNQDGLGQELWSSLSTSLQALAISTLIALPLAYLSLVPAIKPIATAVAELRFLSPAVFFLILLFVASSGHMVKVWMLVLGEATYLVTSMVDVVQAIPQDRWDDARTLGMSEWMAMWYVAVRGTVAEALTAIRANAAMGWASIIFVEGIVRSEGGVGVLILNSEKHMGFDQVYAVALCILLVGIVQDWAFARAINGMCPWRVQ